MSNNGYFYFLKENGELSEIKLSSDGTSYDYVELNWGLFAKFTDNKISNGLTYTITIYIHVSHVENKDIVKAIKNLLFKMGKYQISEVLPSSTYFYQGD